MNLCSHWANVHKSQRRWMLGGQRVLGRFVSPAELAQFCYSIFSYKASLGFTVSCGSTLPTPLNISVSGSCDRNVKWCWPGNFPLLWWLTPSPPLAGDSLLPFHECWTTQMLHGRDLQSGRMLSSMTSFFLLSLQIDTRTMNGCSWLHSIQIYLVFLFQL